MTDPFVINIKTVLHWGRLFKTTIESNPEEFRANL